MTYHCRSGTTGHASWCTSIPRMLAGEAVTYTTVTFTTVTRHVVTIEESWPRGYGERTLYRWRCSCGVPPGRWVTRRSQAEQGAKTHARRSK